MKKYTRYFLVFLLLLAGCKKYRCASTVYCGDWFNFVLVGYTQAELDTVIIRVYRPDNTFLNPIDSAIIVDTLLHTSNSDRPWMPLYGRSTDSMLKLSPLLSDKMSAIDTANITYDWEIYIVRDHQAQRIQGMKFGGSIKQTVETCDTKGNSTGPGICSRYIASYVLNGKAYNFNGPTLDKYYNYLFVRK